MTLEVLQGEAAGANIAVAGELLIGRAAEGDGCLGGDPEISRRHAVLRRGEDGALSIEDLGSRNGTFVNGVRVAEATPLGSGDRVELGRTVLAVREVGAGPDIAVPGRPAATSAPEATSFPAPSEQIGSPTSIRAVPTSPREAARPADLIYDGRRVPVPPQGLAIGRTDDNDLAIATPLTSRRHARVGIREGRHFVADLGSANGTLLNGERLRGEARWLNSGDTLRIGGESLRFVAGEATAFGESPPAGAAPRAVRVEGEQLTIGRDEANDVVLDDPNVSRFHAEIVTGGGAAELRDLGSRNGTRVDGEAVTRARLEVGSEIRIGAFRLLFDGSGLLQRDDHGALRLRAEGLTVAVRDKVILNRADVELNPGELVVVIGESGSGKSTMVKALAGVSTPTDGAVTVNGDPVASRLTDIGYVPQEEIVHPHLTLLEALRYSARLRLPKDSSEEDIEEAVRRVLEELSLSEHAETRIGSLSGGQRKRAGMGAELLNRPSLFFLDEPTTGLDPGLETRMMELFRDLAEEGTRAVMVVTHATKNLALADRVCVMGRGGEPAFFGPPAEAKEFFGVEDYDGIYTALDERPATEWRQRFEAGRDLPTLEADPEVALEAPARAGEKAPKRRTGAQTGVLVSRYLKLVARDRRNLLILLGQVPVIALGIALLFQPGVLGGPGEGRPDDAAQLLFLLVTTSIWFGSIDGSREIIKEKALSLREQAAGVRVGPYLTSKAVVLFGLVTVQAFLLALVVFAIRPLDASATTYLAVLGTLMLTGFVAVGMGLLISASVGSEDQATSLIPLALIPQLLFAGAIVPVERMGTAISAISNLVFARWSFATVGTEVDLNARFAAVQESAVPEFGSSFFELALVAGGAILLAFLTLFFGAVYMKLARREG